MYIILAGNMTPQYKVYKIDKREDVEKGDRKSVV